MGYIWTNYDSEKIFNLFIDSPYMETWDNSKKNVGVNIDIRLDELFFPKNLLENIDKTGDLFISYESDLRYKDIFNILCHFVVKLDRNMGITYKNLTDLNVYKNIEDGFYGENARNKFKELTEKDKIKICRCIGKYVNSEEREIQIDSAIKYFFDEVNLFYEQSTKIIHVCIFEEGNKYNQNVFSCICYFLQDIKIDMRVYWLKEHFGIIGIDETMGVDNIVLI